MRAVSVWAAATIALSTLSGCAGTSASSLGEGDSTSARQPPRCFSARQIRNFTTVNSTTVNVHVGRHVYRVETLGSCPDLGWTDRMALVTRGTSQVCVGSGLGVSVVTRGPTGRQRCAIRSITVLAPDGA